MQGRMEHSNADESGTEGRSSEDEGGQVESDLARDEGAASVDWFGDAHRANISSRMVPPSLCAEASQQMLHAFDGVQRHMP